jgi:Fe-S cluster assembly ATP-binding protein
MNILEAQNISVKVNNYLILNDISFKIKVDETWLVFGPNGGGKSSLMYTLMGYPDYELYNGKVSFMAQDIKELDIYERALLGMGFGVQNPPEIKGITLGDMLRHCLEKPSDYTFLGREKELIETLGMDKLLERKLNLGFSGGEKKRLSFCKFYFRNQKWLFSMNQTQG